MENNYNDDLKKMFLYWGGILSMGMTRKVYWSKIILYFYYAKD